MRKKSQLQNNLCHFSLKLQIISINLRESLPLFFCLKAEMGWRPSHYHSFQILVAVNASTEMVIVGTLFAVSSHRFLALIYSIIFLPHSPPPGVPYLHLTMLNLMPSRSFLRQVGFSYPTRPEDAVFESLSITVAPGETLALCGSSGGGKSTVTKVRHRISGSRVM